MKILEIKGRVTIGDVLYVLFILFLLVLNLFNSIYCWISNTITVKQIFLNLTILSSTIFVYYMVFRYIFIIKVNKVNNPSN